MPPRALLKEWVNSRLDGQLDAVLAQMKDDGLTIDQMVDALRERDAVASRESVRRWLNDLHTPEPEEAVS